jgi:hypothetical protein
MLKVKTMNLSNYNESLKYLTGFSNNKKAPDFSGTFSITEN